VATAYPFFGVVAPNSTGFDSPARIRCFHISTPSDTSSGEVSLNKDEERTYVAKFPGSERLLTDVNLGNRIEWELAFPQRQVIRDYLMGNLELFVESIWEKDKKQGQVVLRLSDISFFDHEHHLISGVRTTLAMLYRLFEKGIKFNKKTLEVNFTESN
jgi:hypothetical protein